MIYNVIGSSSVGNAVIYHNSIMVDCGLPYSKIEPYLHDLQLILLTHQHPDHINHKTLDRICFERPSLRVGCCPWMFDDLHYARNIDVYQPTLTYNYNDFDIVPIQLYHDVPNCGYRIIKPDYKIIHATDTAHLNGIDAPNYDLFALEHNYNEDTIDKDIEELFYKKGAANTHLSEQQARDFVFKNKGDKYEILRLHESTTL